MIYTEHKIDELRDCSFLSKDRYEYSFPKERGEQLCYSVWKEDEVYKIETGYFIGLDWIERNIKHINIQPKLNFCYNGENIREIDYLTMLFSCLKHSEVANMIGDLVVVKWDEPTIEITQNEDVLTPFIIMDFLNIVRAIVKKGLKRSYYKTTKTLNGRIKGKLLVKQTMQMHLSKGNMLHNVCSFDEFDIDNKENRLLKKAIEFVKSYMSSSPLMENAHAVTELVSFVSPAFESVSSDIDVEDMKQMKSNTLFKEYDKGIRLAKMILKRFSYNISNTAKKEIPTPPFWIDMPILFELHVLSMLKDSFLNMVKYHLTSVGNEIDYLLNCGQHKWVVDAKYIPRWWSSIMDEGKTANVRQVCGYARLEKVYKYFGIDYPEEIKCLVIYPDIDNGVTSFDNLNLADDKNAVRGYHGVYKLGVKIPVIDQGL